METEEEFDEKDNDTLIQAAVASSFDLLPTGKQHVSFSEVKDWVDCSWRHKLKQVDKVGVDKPGVHADFGTACHSVAEHYILTRVLDITIFKKTLFELWKTNQLLYPDVYTTEAFKQFAKEGVDLLPELPRWLDESFPGWEPVDAEHLLYEQIDGHPHAFKGYIDCIIKVPVKNKFVYWIIDFKTCGWGWKREKKEDPTIRMQPVLYKNFWTIKKLIEPRHVRCGFVLMKRTAKPGMKFELVDVPAGPVTVKRSLSVINNMLTSVKRGRAIKNRTSCQYCEFFETNHCT